MQRENRLLTIRKNTLARKNGGNQPGSEGELHYYLNSFITRKMRRTRTTTPTETHLLRQQERLSCLRTTNDMTLLNGNDAKRAGKGTEVTTHVKEQSCQEGQFDQ
jgi:hypothetical protein